jgi:hypothetical protein
MVTRSSVVRPDNKKTVEAIDDNTEQGLLESLSDRDLNERTYITLRKIEIHLQSMTELVIDDCDIEERV